MSHKKLFAGSEIMVLAVKDVLEENNIRYIVRDDIDSAITAGFGSADKAVHVFVEEEDLARAKELLKKNDLEE
ncbi:putative signal transducing protein [Myroides phaeus]|uniref:Signal transducing protein n=1 Tax=Myroides phaeus TaxID=702745 RepID=A0A1G8EHW0_9FLAO|nr:DUF2007 domain-containing protein [Myroides phaeus]MEC4116410.1 DUF2007 domain-containing protein [Myroides phaeus]SDH69466.1 Putative signal transducing protein [Myroides phaeus]